MLIVQQLSRVINSDVKLLPRSKRRGWGTHRMFFGAAMRRAQRARNVGTRIVHGALGGSGGLLPQENLEI